MPGYSIARSGVKDPQLFDDYKCPFCHLLLKDAVQPNCGHRLCQSCVEELHSSPAPRCPRLDCREYHIEEDSKETVHYYPDRCARLQVKGMIVYCSHKQKECTWEGRLAELEDHLKTCEFNSEKCQYCGEEFAVSQLESHKSSCPKMIVKCPLAGHGCNCTDTMTRAELEEHNTTDFKKHFNVLISLVLKSYDTRQNLTPVSGSSNQPPTSLEIQDRRNPKSCFFVAVESEPLRVERNGRADVVAELRREIARNRSEIRRLREQNTSLQNQVRSGNAESEDRDFRLSLIENTNYNGRFVWKIPEFSKRMTDAQTGRYTSIFSLPFYTGRYGYKMCLRLYILGDGIGKNSHMSLFFVVMKGEFDNILQWPFTHKVTFKLINQTGGRDIIDTFQPDPMSSSFRKPKSDMNVASGCPQFISQSELKNGGFTVDDVIFIKCIVDCRGLNHS